MVPAFPTQFIEPLGEGFQFLIRKGSDGPFNLFKLHHMWKIAWSGQGARAQALLLQPKHREMLYPITSETFTARPSLTERSAASASASAISPSRPDGEIAAPLEIAAMNAAISAA